MKKTFSFSYIILPRLTHRIPISLLKPCTAILIVLLFLMYAVDSNSQVIFEKTYGTANPANAEIKLVLNEDLNYFISVMVYNADGQIIFSRENIPPNLLQQVYNIDTRLWSAGLYYIKLSTVDLHWTKK